MRRKLLAAFLIVAALVWGHAGADPFLHAPSGVIGEEPTQAATDRGAFDFTDYGFFAQTYRIAPLAAYDVKGRVLHKRRYYADKYSGDLIPFDLALGWRHLSDRSLLHEFFEFDHRADTGGGRFLWMNWKTGEAGAVRPPPAGIGDPMTQISNNHLIPSTKTVFRQLGAIKAGDLVRLKGYLVKVTDATRPDWEWKSSLTRTDTSTHWGGNNTSCETLFVTSIESILSVEPLRTAPMPEWFWPL